MTVLVKIYTAPLCAYCARAKMLLTSKGVAFEEINVGSSRALWQEMMTLSGRRTVPQIFIAGQAIGGYDDLAALQRAGQLDPLLELS